MVSAVVPMAAILLGYVISQRSFALGALLNLWGRKLAGYLRPDSTFAGTPPSIWTITPNSTGLTVDAAIYKEYLGSQISMLERPPPLTGKENDDKPPTSCVYIFLEVTPNQRKPDMDRRWVPFTSTTDPPQPCRVMVMANTDQFTGDILDMPKLELLLCKTRQCVAWVTKKQEARPSKIPILYTGFTSVAPPELDDTLDLNRFHRFLHVAGRSPHKGTWTILQAWLNHPHWPTLTLTSYNNAMVDAVLPQMKQQLGISKLPPNIQHIDKRLSRKEIDRLMRTHGVHLCLSGMEGFGHYLNEARAVGALLLTPNYPAMNELVTSSEMGVLLEPSNMLEWTNGLPFANVGADELARVINQVVLPMPPMERQERGRRARMAFEQDQSRFHETMNNLRCYIQGCDPASSNHMAYSQRDCARACGLELE
jgi:glycosyltransferase involved in cell wall biosynthesis